LADTVEKVRKPKSRETISRASITLADFDYSDSHVELTLHGGAPSSDCRVENAILLCLFFPFAAALIDSFSEPGSS
jgi:hypothetical protein